VGVGRLLLPESFGGRLAVVAVVSAALAAAGMKLAGSLLPAEAPALAAAPDIAGQASVIDGDTIDIHGARIRLFGIDAPESRQSCTDAEGKSYRCGRRAAFVLADEIRRQTVSCRKRDIDRYGRTVAVCSAGGVELNGWMVRQGWAVAYRHYSRDYVSAETEAKTAKRGIWAGRFEMPQVWRREAADRAAEARIRQAEARTKRDERSDCAIKGNISYKTGERIYHMPGDRYYDATRIDASRGERWFCSEADAQAAGWRHSKR
jgi:endonuclease YncB( thermonuclease family)